jgi:hypothetical protein
VTEDEASRPGSKLTSPREPAPVPPKVQKPKLDYDKDKGAHLTFTFKEGLVVQVLPSGAIKQTICKNKEINRKQAAVNPEAADDAEEYRTVTREGALIRQLVDGNQVIYLRDGTVTRTDHRRGIWTTVSPSGVVRERNLRTGVVKD